MRFVTLVVLTLACHVVLGWRWDLVGGIAAGWLWIQGGWWRGAAVVGSVWLGLVLYSLAVAAGPSLALHKILGNIVGQLPSWSVPILIVAVGTLIGVVGGLIGTQLRLLTDAKRKRAGKVPDPYNGDSP